MSVVKGDATTIEVINIYLANNLSIFLMLMVAEFNIHNGRLNIIPKAKGTTISYLRAYLHYLVSVSSHTTLL